MTPDKITALSDLPNKVLFSTKLRSRQPRADHPRGLCQPSFCMGKGFLSVMWHREAAQSIELPQHKLKSGGAVLGLYTKALRELCSCFQAHLKHVISLGRLKEFGRGCKTLPSIPK